jgi:hypothetical protein
MAFSDFIVFGVYFIIFAFTQVLDINVTAWSRWGHNVDGDNTPYSRPCLALVLDVAKHDSLPLSFIISIRKVILTGLT